MDVTWIMDLLVDHGSAGVFSRCDGGAGFSRYSCATFRRLFASSCAVVLLRYGAMVLVLCYCAIQLLR